MKRFNTLEEVQKAVNNNEVVHWTTSRYIVSNDGFGKACIFDKYYGSCGGYIGNAVPEMFYTGEDN